MSFRQSITGVILAGGRGTRMGGQDKGLIPLLGKPLYQYIIERLQPQVGPMMINANRNQACYQQSHLPVISDLNPDFSGPLAGMQAALHQAKTEWLLFVPCDVPEFPRNLVEKMFCEKADSLSCYACDQEREHPTFALLHHSLRQKLDDYLARGDRKLMLFMQEINAKAIIFPSESESFVNLNTPEDGHNWELQQKIMNNNSLPLLGITAYSGTGKTTLLKKIIPLLRQRNVRVGLIKHTHHNMDVDKPGKDSYELRKAGANQTLVASQERWALMTETPDHQEMDLYYLASRFDPDSLDLILVEGFKHEAIDKIALFRSEVGKPIDGLIDQHVVAIASNQIIDTHVPQLDINNPEQVADYIASWWEKSK